MARKKKKSKKVASDVLDTVADAPKKVRKKTTKKDKVFNPKCDYCGKKSKHSFMEADPEWELPGHPDRIHRAVCVKCSPDVNARYDCASLVFEALKEALTKAGRSPYEIEGAVKIAWRSFHVDLNRDELVSMAKKLKVKHPWLKKKKGSK